MNPRPLRLAGLLATVVLVAAAPALAQQAPTKAPGGQTETAKPAAPGWLGVLPQDAEAAAGADVTTVVRTSPADRAGITTGDRIVAVAGQPVADADALRAALGSHPAQQPVSLSVVRQGTKRDVEVTLGAPPAPDAMLRRHFVGHDAPGFTAELVAPSKKRVSLADYAGKPLIVEFWATWCQPCRQSSREVAAVLDAHPGEVAAVGLSRQDAETVAGFARGHQARFALGTTADAVVQSSYLVSSYPTVFVIDARGKVAGVFVGLGHDAEMRRLVARLVAAKE